MFVDKVQVLVKAGNGGDGVVSFRHEKYVDKGGPNGGDGGKGGDVIFVATRNENTLASFRFQPRLEAQSGDSGAKSNKRGKSGDNLIVKVPVGTMVMHDARLIADLTEDGQEVVVAQGGKGGFGNAHFKSSIRQAPRVAEKGERGEEFQLSLELKMIADIGLVGLPNAGKSTLLSVISNAKPEIGDYPFTTLTPNLGVADIDDHSLLVADIPGLIEGASAGKGLGDEFLRHVERTAVIVHLIDARSEDLIKDYQTIRNELQAYDEDMTNRPQLVVLSKIDGMTEDEIAAKKTQLVAELPKKTKIFAISAQAHHGVTELLREAVKVVSKEREKHIEEATTPQIPVYELKDTGEQWKAYKESAGRFVVTGKKIERFAERTHFGDYHSEERLRDIMQRHGVMHQLKRLGAEPGHVIQVGEPSIGEFEL